MHFSNRRNNNVSQQKLWTVNSFLKIKDQEFAICNFYYFILTY